MGCSLDDSSAVWPALGRGDPGPMLAGYAQDAVLVFPGGELLERGAPGQAGHRGLPPALPGGGDLRDPGRHPRQRAPVAHDGVHGVLDRALGTGGEVVYENRVVVLVRVVWGKIVHHEDFLDTQRVEALDRHLARA